METDIPKKFQRYFWDADRAHVDMEAHAPYVVSRLFEYGNFEALHWIFDHYSKENVLSILEQSREISPRTKHFWTCYLRHQL